MLSSLDTSGLGLQAQIRVNPDAGKPPSKRRKLQPLLPTAVVDERTFASQRYRDQMRHAMANLVHQHLQPGTQERVWADEGRAHLINFTQFRGRDKQSPIAPADVAMCAMYPSSFGKRAESTRHEALRKWFVHIRSPQDCGGGGGSAHDMPRKRQPCTALQLEDWRFCKRALLHWRWLDEDGRSRRHHGLQHAYEMNDEAGREGNQRAWEDAQELQRILSVSKTLCFGNLTASVMTHWQLQWATEQFHEPRSVEKHWVHAQRYLSLQPVVEYYRSGGADPQNASHCKKVVVRAYNPEYRPFSSSQLRKQASASAAPARTPSGVPDTRALPTEIKQREDARGNAKFVDERLLYDDSKEQIIASVDGFSVWLEADDGMVGYSVCVEEGEQLATLRCPKKAPRKELDKNYYMAITLPGYGALETALIKSGSKERSSSYRDDSKYWFERIVELELNFAGEPDAVQKRQALQDELSARTWEVCTD